MNKILTNVVSVVMYWVALFVIPISAFVTGNEMLGNLTSLILFFVGWLWVFVAGGYLGIYGASDRLTFENFQKVVQEPHWLVKLYQNFCAVALTLTMVFTGHVFVAGLYVVCWGLWCAAKLGLKSEYDEKYSKLV